MFLVLLPCIPLSFVLMTGGSFSLPAFLIKYLFSRRGIPSSCPRTRGVDICCCCFVRKGSLDEKVDDVIGLMPVGTFNCWTFFKIGRYVIYNENKNLGVLDVETMLFHVNGCKSFGSKHLEKRIKKKKKIETNVKIPVVWEFFLAKEVDPVVGCVYSWL